MMDMQNKKTDFRGRKKSSIDLGTMVYGKVQPQAKDLEEAILGLIQLNPGSIDEVSGILSENSFYIEANQKIYSAALALNNRNQQIDSLSLVAELKAREELEAVGGPFAVVKLTNNVTSSVNIGKWAQIVHQKFIQREIIRIAGEMISDAYEDSTDAFDLLDRSEESLSAIGSNNFQNEMTTIESAVIRAVTKIEQNRLLDSSITGVPSGIPSLDLATRGWQPGFIVLAARPSVGKSAVALQLAKNAADNTTRPVTVGIWSMEMDDVQNVLRMMSAESGVTLYKMQTGRLEQSEMHRIVDAGVKLSKHKIFFDDSSGITLNRFKAKARRLKRKHGLGLIIVDYLQLMGGDDKGGNREQEISRLSRGMKMFSRELGIPIIALSQMSRDIEKRPGKDKKPKMSDIRESGAIEQDADVIILLWGPDDDELVEKPELVHRRYARIAKQRDGVLQTINLHFDTRTQLITEYQEEIVKPQSNWKPITTEPDLFTQEKKK